MPTYTSKLGLVKPDPSEDINIGQLNTNFERLDSTSGGMFKCTSTTRPTGSDRWDGRLIFETDTKTILFWNGTAWQSIAYRTGGTIEYAPDNQGTNKTTSQRINSIALPIVQYPRLFTVSCFWTGALTADGDITLRVQAVESGATPVAPDTGTALAAQRITNPGTSNWTTGATVTTSFIINAGQYFGVQWWVQRNAGTYSILENNGYSVRVDFVEADSGSNW